MDKALRDSERAATRGSAQDRAMRLRQRVRAGELTQQRVEPAAVTCDPS